MKSKLTQGEPLGRLGGVAEGEGDGFAVTIHLPAEVSVFVPPLWSRLTSNFNANGAILHIFRTTSTGVDVLLDRSMP